MENPVAEVSRIIELLCTAPPDKQRAVIETYFTPTASFTHPFCRTGSFSGSQWLIIIIYRWYKILSPHIDVAIDGIAFDEQRLRLYVSIHQNFKLWVVPFYSARVKLVTVLQLTTDPTPTPTEHQQALQPLTTAEIDAGKNNGEANNGDLSKSTGEDADKNQSNGQKSADSPERVRYWIQSQNDLYQTTEWIKFLVPWGLGVFLMIVWQFYATLLCVAGTKIYDMLKWISKKLYWLPLKLFDNDNRRHPHLGAD